MIKTSFIAFTSLFTLRIPNTSKKNLDSTLLWRNHKEIHINLTMAYT
ncbi:MAG: hypothetical protein ACI9IZ_001543, partial [Nonlabens sp.]